MAPERTLASRITAKAGLGPVLVRDVRSRPAANAEQPGEGVVAQANQTDANLGRYSSSVQLPRAAVPHAVPHALTCFSVSLPGAGEVRPVVL